MIKSFNFETDKNEFLFSSLQTADLKPIIFGFNSTNLETSDNPNLPAKPNQVLLLKSFQVKF